MARVTKFDATQLAKDLLNETSLFWDATKPTSGLEPNSFFLDTAEGQIYQNTNTEPSPTWTKRVGALLLQAEANTTTVATSVDHGAVFQDKRYYGQVETLPTTEEFYIITGIEWFNGATATGDVMTGVDFIDVMPPVSPNVISIAVASAATAQSGTSALQRASSYTNYIAMPKGAKIAPWINLSGAGTLKGVTKSSENTYKVETYSTTPSILNTTAWTADTEDLYLKIYFQGYDG